MHNATNKLTVKHYPHRLFVTVCVRGRVQTDLCVGYTFKFDNFYIHSRVLIKRIILKLIQNKKKINIILSPYTMEE